ncbi:unnamed protein product [Adineta ricciae]|uniref:CCHC-type domain-containing protein n=1 Tax=Adineta ricciae TaxID=249248 RepID=A0A815V111_ADIRI|nr:unnamed protein product [Adineta ricciae]CAF1548985.1 unnamed protein product [Adineta ricciae]
MATRNYQERDRRPREETENEARDDRSEKAFHETMERRRRYEQQFDYSVKSTSNDYTENYSRNKFKRQLTSNSHIEEYDTQGPDDDNQFTYVSKGVKRRPINRKPNDNETSRNDGRQQTYQTNAATNIGGRTFVNSNNRMNKNKANDVTETNYYMNKQHTTNSKSNRENERSSDAESGINDSPAIQLIEPRKSHQTKNTEINETNLITQHALQYAVEHHLPPITIECNPKIDSSEKAKAVIKNLCEHIEEKFRQVNKNCKFPIGFDYWFINKDGNLTCYTKHIELFVYLSDRNNYPSQTNNIDILPVKPNHLPPQNSIVLKFIPNYITNDEIQDTLTKHMESIYKIEEMKGSKTGKHRHVRIELKSSKEYEQLLKNGGIPIDGQIIEAEEFLAPPRLLICNKCNDPGHTRKNCYAKYDICRRCGKDRTTGEHNKCTIKCHRCQENHMSTDYNCRVMMEFRLALIRKLRERPNLLPPNVRIFIPVDCREQGNLNNKILMNPHMNVMPDKNAGNKQTTQNRFDTNQLAWPALPPASNSPNNTTFTNQNYWEELKNKEEELNKTKDEMNKKLSTIEAKYNDHLKKMNSVLVCMAQQTKHQNESVERCFTTINEILPILSTTLEIMRQVTTKIQSTNNSSSDNNDIRDILQHVSLSIDCIKDRNELLVSNQTACNKLMEQQSQIMNQVITNLMNNDG